MYTMFHSKNGNIPMSEAEPILELDTQASPYRALLSQKMCKNSNLSGLHQLRQKEEQFMWGDQRFPKKILF